MVEGLVEGDVLTVTPSERSKMICFFCKKEVPLVDAYHSYIALYDKESKTVKKYFCSRQCADSWYEKRGDIVTGNVLEQAWQSYSDHAFSDKVEISVVQMKETRLAFYSGMWDMFRRLTEVSDSLDEDSAVSVLEDIFAEFDAFKKREGIG